MPFLNLPNDIIFLITPYLSLKDFLNFSAVCKSLHDLKADSLYWKNATHSTFRLPVRLSDRRDGTFWMKIYKRMATQTKVYLWGQQTKAREMLSLHTVPDYLFRINHKQIPGVIVDFQIGGWATVFLNSIGDVYVIGDLNTDLDQLHEVHREGIVKLQSSQKVRLISTGRSHVLGLTDCRDILYWHDSLANPAVITFHEIAAMATKVCAGWNRSSAYFPGFGIAIWSLPRRSDLLLYREATPPYLAPPYYLIPETNSVITSYALLEKFVVFSTVEGSAFISFYPDMNPFADTVTFAASIKIPLISRTMEVQGSFRAFAIFEEGDKLLIGLEEQVLPWLRILKNGLNQSQTHDFLNEFLRIPCLQQTGVIQMAFGDYHYHALHSDGTITSYGHSPGSMNDTSPDPSGPLGLFPAQGTSQGRDPGDAVLYPHGYVTGRRVLFHRSQRQYASSLSQHVANLNDREEIGVASEWVEQQLRGWDDWEAVQAVNDDGLSAHFALSIAAGGWSSGAIILENPTIVQKMAEEWPSRRCSVSNLNPDSLVWKTAPPNFRYHHTANLGDSVFGVPKWRELDA